MQDQHVAEALGRGAVAIALVASLVGAVATLVMVLATLGELQRVLRARFYAEPFGDPPPPPA